MRQPALADHVDSIAVHLLPYWEGVPVEEAVDYALQRYAEVRERFPGKPVVIGEIGWPSNGDRRAAALATPDREAVFVRTFLARAASLNLDYYLMEVVDQPWKRAIEGAVSAHWGLLDAARQAKFAFAGPLQADPYWSGKALLATTLGLLTVILLLIVVSPMRLAGRLSLALSLQAVISFTVFLVGVPLEHYLRPVDIVPLALLAPALAMIAAILLVQVFEFSELFWPGSLHRQVTLRPLAVDAPAPFVSIYLACCNEPPEMVKATIDSLLALDWPAFEVLVVDNNSGDPASMGLSHAIARGVIAGLRGRQAVFHVTRKGPVDRLGKTRPARRPGAFASVREEAVLLIGLLVSIAAISVQSGAATSAGAGGMLLAILGMQLRAFMEHRMAQDAVLCNLEIIGEASHKIEAHCCGFAAAHPELPLAFAYQMRNAVVHGYFKVDLEIVWRTIHTDLPALYQPAQALIPAAGCGSKRPADSVPLRRRLPGSSAGT